MSNHKPSLKRREVISDVETSSSPLCWDKPESYLITDLGGVRRADGMSLVQALIRNVRPCCVDVKGKIQSVDTVEDESTDARSRFGTVHSSDEVWETRWSEGAVSFSFIYLPTVKAGGAYE